MDTKQISLIGIKLIAIYLIAQGITTIPNIYLFINTFAPTDEYNLYTYASVIVSITTPIIVGIFVWFSAPRLSGYISSSIPTVEAATPPGAHQYQAIGIMLIGLYLFANTLPHAISIIYQLLFHQNIVNDQPVIDKQMLINAITINLKVLIGLVLILGSRKLSALFTWLRHAGT